MVSQLDFDMELAELWDAASGKLRDRDSYLDSLEGLLRSNGITEENMLLDVAGGFGFPAIDLSNRGYQVLYLDGSPGMLEKAMRNADLEGAPAYIFSFQSIGYSVVPWQQLGDTVGSDSFDALLCTGNSLPYAVSWGRADPDLSESKNQILMALGQFYRVLNEGGMLFVDKQPEVQNCDVEEVGEVKLNGERLYVTCSFNNDKDRRIRNWTLSTRNLDTKEVVDYPSQGYLLLEDELLPLLKETGFREVTKHILDGDIYEGFVAVK
ncbi:hypothetical protein CMI42_06570 [Candidatus Pacearchaeota archaeon]|nr:hypothetical protein [Candidatus Pacearchaeota archaeon]|tara:strand:+ start:954 stop:1751 length:798 start_codon:yes stop_codon:yes gene_type:complete